ncbi:MAG: recombination protein RecR [Clostridia bacterium]|nr:recombination protein RecR [Clostridia bacterium]
MADYVLPLGRLIDSFRKLPGIGSKTATRLAFAVLNLSEEDAANFASAILESKNDIHTCPVCCNLTLEGLCPICADAERDGSMLCVVETPKDVMAFERVREYRGVYHVLGGVLSPMNGITPEMLHIKELLSRLEDDTVKEILIATNPNVEGEATASYLARLLKPFGVKISRLAYGLPVGSDLEYTDEVTLHRAIEGRRPMNG